MSFEEIRNKFVPKRYLVSDYLVKYKNDLGEIMEILVPNKHGRVLNRHEVKALSIRYIKKNTQNNKPQFISYEKHGTCAFCPKFGKLERSHIIGKTVFNYLFKQCENGQAIRISLSDSQVVKKESDSWAIEMLCTTCESFFNKSFEDYVIHVLREENIEVSITKSAHGMFLRGVDQKKLLLYTISLFWRGAYSIVKAYDAIEITYGVDAYLREVILGKIKILPRAYSIKISKLYDELNVLNEDSIKQLIINPFIRKENNHVVYCIVYEGYLFEIFLISTFKQRQLKGFISVNSKTLFIPYVDIFSIDGIAEFLGGALYKHDQSSRV